MNSVSVVPKELSQYKKEVLNVQQAANSFVVKTIGDLEKGADLLHEVKRVEDLIIERKESITRPLMQGLASARDLFKPLELGYAEAKKTIKAKMLAFQIEEADRIEKEKARVLKRVEKGTMRADTGVAKLEGIGDAPVSAKGAIGKVGMRTVKKMRIIDETAIPREFMVPDMAKITEVVLRSGVTVPGVEVYEEKILVQK